LDRQGIGRSPVLVCIERTGVELLSLALPPVTDAELPDLVANETLRESTAAVDGAAFDFLTLAGGDAGSPRKVLAAVLPSEQRQRIEATLSVACLQMQRLMPRCVAAAVMFQRLAPPSEEWRLLVHPGAEEVDFIVFHAGQIAFVRTARLPSVDNREQRNAWLESEIRRTLTVAAAETDKPPIVEGVYILGRQEEFGELCERVRQGPLLPAHVVDPLEKQELPAEFVPEHPERFAALLGMLLDEADKGPSVMDFLNPHRPPRRVSRVKMGAVSAAAALLLAILGASYVWYNLSKVWRSNDELSQKLKQLDKRFTDSAKTRRLFAAVRTWRANDVIWLDELREFAERFPPARDALALRMQMNAASNGGVIIFQGLVRDPALIVRLEYALRDAYHIVQCRRIQTGSRPDEDFTHLFDATIAVGQRKMEQYRKPEAPPDAKSPSKKGTGSEPTDARNAKKR